ncbi:MAG: RsmB/NOP family class I SAM-dependent RNA methyltransferase [Pseudomonadota bacterium]
MLDAARINAVIELLSECFAKWQEARPLPADIILNRYFRSRRFIGSKDRGFIASSFYKIIRNYATLNWHVEKYGQVGARSFMIAALVLFDKKIFPELRSIFNGDRFSPYKLSKEEIAFIQSLEGKELTPFEMPEHARYNYPLWLEERIKSAFGNKWISEITALSEEAPVDLRANTLVTTRDELLKALREENYRVEPSEISPLGIRMKTRSPIFTSNYFKLGWFEMQDAGSQVVSSLLGAKSGQKIIDFCAGAGGKTLAIAAAMQNKGRILAWDTSEKRLNEMKERLKRAKVDNVQIHNIESESDIFVKRHRDSADAVIVDAPCSGTGTWRRNPDLKWRLRESDLSELTEIQKKILLSSAKLVKKDGYLLYITCSVLKTENEDQIDAFMQQVKNFRVASYNELCSNLIVETIKQSSFLKLTPYLNGTDGFFAALLQRIE